MKKTTKKIIGVLASTAALGATGIIGGSSVSAAGTENSATTGQNQKHEAVIEMEDQDSTFEFELTTSDLKQDTPTQDLKKRIIEAAEKKYNINKSDYRVNRFRAKQGEEKRHYKLFRNSIPLSLSINGDEIKDKVNVKHNEKVADIKARLAEDYDLQNFEIKINGSVVADDATPDSLGLHCDSKSKLSIETTSMDETKTKVFKILINGKEEQVSVNPDESLKEQIAKIYSLQDLNLSINESYKEKQEQFSKFSEVDDDMTPTDLGLNSESVLKLEKLLKISVNGEVKKYAVDYSDNFAKIKKDCGLSNFNIKMGGSEINDDMIPDDLGLGFNATPLTAEPVTPTAEAEPEKVEYTIGLVISFMPNFGKFRVTPNTTLKEMEAQVRAKWKLDGIAIEFVTIDLDGDCKLVSDTTQIGAIDHTEYTLCVRAAESGGEASTGSGSLGDSTTTADDAPSVNPQANQIQDDEWDPTDPANKDSIQILFKIEQRDNKEVRLVFAKKAKVEEAKERVATLLGLSPEAVTLLYAGKALKDAFVLDRLRVGEQGIAVYIKDTTEVLLLTAKANDPNRL